MIHRIFVNGISHLLDDSDGTMLPPVMGGQEIEGPPVPSTYVPPPGSQTPAGGVYPPPAPIAPIAPNPDDYWVTMDMYGNEVPATPHQEGAWQNVYSFNRDLADYLEFGEPDKPSGSSGARGPSPAENFSHYAAAMIAAVDAEIAAGRLSLEQATAQFNARMDAFAEAGKQRSEMWQYTVAPSQVGQPLHSDIRGRLDMEPWISEAVEIDPFAEAQEFVNAMPEMTVPSTDPLQELVEIAQGFLG